MYRGGGLEESGDSGPVGGAGRGFLEHIGHRGEPASSESSVKEASRSILVANETYSSSSFLQ